MWKPRISKSSFLSYLFFFYYMFILFLFHCFFFRLFSSLAYFPKQRYFFSITPKHPVSLQVWSVRVLQAGQLGRLVAGPHAVLPDPAPPPHLLLPALPAPLHLQWATALTAPPPPSPLTLTLTRKDQLLPQACHSLRQLTSRLYVTVQEWWRPASKAFPFCKYFTRM